LAVCSSDRFASLFHLASTLGVLDAQKTLVLALAVRSEDRRCFDVAMHRGAPRSLEALRQAPYIPSFPRSCTFLCRRAAHHRYRSTGSTDVSSISCSEERLANESRARERGVLAEASSPRMTIAERRHRSPVGRPRPSEECRGAIRNRRIPKESCAVGCSLRHRSAEVYQLPKKPLGVPYIARNAEAFVAGAGRSARPKPWCVTQSPYHCAARRLCCGIGPSTLEASLASSRESELRVA
jgi:hypothetical protein